MSWAAFCVSNAVVLHHVKAYFATTDSIVEWGTFSLHFLVLRAKVVAVQTPGQVVPQLCVVAALALFTLCLHGGSAVSSEVSPRSALFALQDFTC